MKRLNENYFKSKKYYKKLPTEIRFLQKIFYLYGTTATKIICKNNRIITAVLFLWDMLLYICDAE